MISGLADRKGLYQLKQLKSYMKLKLHFRIYIYLFCVDFIDMNSTTTTKKNHTIISNINIQTSFQAYDTGKGEERQWKYHRINLLSNLLCKARESVTEYKLSHKPELYCAENNWMTVF